MSTSQPAPIRPQTAFHLSSAGPHLYESPFFPAGPVVPLCGAQERLEFELLRPCEAFDIDTLIVGHQSQYVDVIVGCADCKSIYQDRFQQ